MTVQGRHPETMFGGPPADGSGSLWECDS